MKTLVPKSFFIALLMMFCAQSVKSACSASYTKSISGMTVAFTNTSSTSGSAPFAVHYNWSFTGGLSSSLKNPIITFTTPGIKTVTLIIFDSSTSCSNTITDTLFISGSACAAHFTATISGMNVGLTNHSLNTNGTDAGLSYYWSFSDGTSSTSKNLVKTFSTIGYKTIQLTIQDSSQGCFSTMNDTILLPFATSCAAIFTKSITGLTVTFANSSRNNNGLATGLSYYWNFSDGTSSTLKNPTKTFSSTGVKVATLSISDSSTGCISSKTDSFMLSSSVPTCNASFTKTISGLTVTFNNTSTTSGSVPSAVHYSWYFSDGTSSDLKNPVKTYATAGTKVAHLYLYDSSTGCNTSFSDTFIVITPGSCAASFSRNISGLTVTLTNTSVNTTGGPTGLSYYWYFWDGTSSTLKNPTKTFALGGTKIIFLTIYDTANGCSSTITDTIMLHSTSCAASFTKTVSGLTVTLNNTSVSSTGSGLALTYLWTFNDGTSSTVWDPVKTFSTAGLKTISLAISDTMGCTSSFTDTVLLVPAMPLCSASFSLAVDTTTPFHFFLLNTSIIRSTSTFFWNFGDGGTSTQMTPTHTYANFGSYYVCLTVSDTLCTSTFCDTIGMDSTGRLLKQGAFGFQTLDFTTVSTTTGTPEVNASTEYTIYPNPSAADIHIDFTLTSATPITFQITDITGKVVFSKTENRSSGVHSETIDTRDLKPSIYFLTITSPTGQKNYKLIKN